MLTWLSANQALALGFDEILTNHEKEVQDQPCHQSIVCGEGRLTVNTAPLSGLHHRFFEGNGARRRQGNMAFVQPKSLAGGFENLRHGCVSEVSAASAPVRGRLSRACRR